MVATIQNDLTNQHWEETVRLILANERKYHKAFFGKIFDLTAFMRVLKDYGPEDLARWTSLYLEPHFLPEVDILPWNDFPGWRIKIGKLFYEAAGSNGSKIMCRQENDVLGHDHKFYKLPGRTVLIDTRLKNHKMMDNDMLMGDIMIWLRRERRIKTFRELPLSSRFGPSSNDWDQQIRPALIKALGFKPRQVRLEKVVEANTIPQIYPHMPRLNDGKFQTEVWCEEFCAEPCKESCCTSINRFSGGIERYGGLSYFSPMDRSDRWMQRAFRPIFVL